MVCLGIHPAYSFWSTSFFNFKMPFSYFVYLCIIKRSNYRTTLCTTLYDARFVPKLHPSVREYTQSFMLEAPNRTKHRIWLPVKAQICKTGTKRKLILKGAIIILDLICGLNHNRYQLNEYIFLFLIFLNKKESNAVV